MASTHRNLEALVREGKFREDLYFRLKVVTLGVPALRERREDIPLLCEHFLAAARARVPAARLAGFSPEAIEALETHPWPGNVRELKHLVESLVVTATAPELGAAEVRRALGSWTIAGHPLERAQRDLMPLRELEQAYIAWILERTGHNKTRAAEILGIDPSTLYRREVRGKPER
jgi:two-component system response regulator HydG